MISACTYHFSFCRFTIWLLACTFVWAEEEQSHQDKIWTHTHTQKIMSSPAERRAESISQWKKVHVLTLVCIMWMNIPLAELV